MREGQSLMFLGAATIDSPFDRLHLSFMRTVYSTALIFMNKGRNYAYLSSITSSSLHLPGSKALQELDSENSRMEKEITKLSKQLMEAESAIKNLKDELLKAQTELMLSRMDKRT